MHVKANVILVKCTQSKKLFGMRVQQQGSDWIRTWAFPIQENVASKEGFGNVKIQGSLNVTDEYPGCPYCETKGFFSCGVCNKLNCYHGEELTKCEWCGNSAETSAVDEFEVEGGGY